MPGIHGTDLPVSLARSWVNDMLTISRGVPLIPIERSLQIAALAEARERSEGRLSWAALMLKAVSLVARTRPELRQCYLSYPWPRLWQADETLASVTVSREYQNQPAVFFFHLATPDRLSLAEIQEELTQAKQGPIDAQRTYRRLIRYAQWPLILRRLVWWYGYHINGRTRARYFGTVGLSTTAGAGARLTHLISPLAATFSYGPITTEGYLPATLVFDHRVMDGVVAAEILAALETTLNTEIVAELRACAQTIPRACEVDPAGSLRS